MSRLSCGSGDRELQEKLKLILYTTVDLLESDSEPRCTSGIPNLVHDVVWFGRYGWGVTYFRVDSSE